MRKHISVLLAIAIVVSMLTAGFVNRSYAEETTVTIVTADLGYANETAVGEVSQGGVTITFDKGSGANDPKYYTSGTAIPLMSAASAIPRSAATAQYSPSVICILSKKSRIIPKIISYFTRRNPR